MANKCVECDRTIEELSDNDIDLRNDDYCDECHSKLMEEWEAENEELNRYWRSTRL